MTKRSWLAPAQFTLALGLLAAMGCEAKHSAMNPADRDHAALVWAQAQGIESGSTRELQLPASLSAASVTGTVYAARTTDGRTCVLLKTRVGFKDNFEGRLRLDGPIRASELVGVAPRPYISLAGLPPFEELYVRSRYGANAFDVYFDLN